MTFERAIEHVLAQEGGFQADRNDKGNWTGGQIGMGELKGTKWGISAASYPHADIRGLTRDAAKAIYERDFWRAASCEALPPMARLAVLDAAVNCGVGTAVRWAQRAAGVEGDGKVGPATRAAWASADARRMLEEFMWLRTVYHARIAQANSPMRQYLYGWIIRCGTIRQTCLLAGS